MNDIAVFAIVAVGLAAFVAAPLYRRQRPQSQPDDSVARADAASSALRDLEVDRASGLIDEGTYQRERAALESSAGFD